MSLRFGVVMDPIEKITPYKDSTLAMMLAIEQHDAEIVYIEPADIFVSDGNAYANAKPMHVFDSNEHWFECGESFVVPLGELDIILMRKDPPFNTEYIFATYALDLAKRDGALVANDPRALRNFNEKFTISYFPQCTVPNLVSKDMEQLRRFVKKHQTTILKPLEGMGGSAIFKLTPTDPNVSVVLETLTNFGQTTIMAQQFIPDISNGDKRILLINGEPVSHALARIPAQGETRGNLAAGGRGVVQPLSDRDYWIAQQVGPFLKENGIYFAGIDVIGDYLTEINITSPTCIREISKGTNMDIAGKLIDTLIELNSQKPLS